MPGCRGTGKLPKIVRVRKLRNANAVPMSQKNPRSGFPLEVSPTHRIRFGFFVFDKEARSPTNCHTDRFSCHQHDTCTLSCPSSICLLFVDGITTSPCGSKMTRTSPLSLCTRSKVPTSDVHCVAIICGHAAGTQAQDYTHFCSGCYPKPFATCAVAVGGCWCYYLRGILLNLNSFNYSMIS